MSTVLWPRQEVLQLVIPQLGVVGKTLDNATAINAIKQLSKFQTVEGKISFDRWLVIGKDCLHWNDNCIRLFWEMLCLAVYYLNRDPSLYPSREEVLMDLEYIAIFLVLHVVDAHPSKSATSSPNVHDDSIWPAHSDGEREALLSPSSSPPKNDIKKKHPSMGSPLSPRSPKQSVPSPKDAASKTRLIRTPRSMAQYLHSVRQKIPIILKALGSEDDLHLEGIGHFTPEKSNNEELQHGLIDFPITRKTIDALGLIVCGGRSRDEHIANISVLHSNWSGELDSSARKDSDGPASQSAVVQPSPYSTGTTLGFSELLAWINLHLAMNDILYPVSISSFYSQHRGAAGGAPVGGGGSLSESLAVEMMPEASSLGDNSNHPKNCTPSRTCTPVSSLTRFTPTVIQNCQTTVMHVITSGPSRAPSFRRINSARSQDMMDINRQYSARFDLEPEALHTKSASKIDFEIPMIDVPSSHRMDDDEITVPSVNTPEDLDLLMKSHSNTSSSGNNTHNHSSTTVHPSPPPPERGLWSATNTTFNGSFYFGGGSSSLSNTQAFQRPELSLPQLFVSDCRKSSLYFISPYYSGSITGCEDCEIVIGAVFGAVIIDGCERVRITVACRKLIVLNCLDCDFNIATMSPTIISGDSRGLSFGPYNASYRNMKSHLQMADLQPLSANGVDASPESTSNCWSTLCDVNSCLETLLTSNSPSGYAVDAMAMSSFALMPTPSAATATIAPLEKFKTTMIPFKQECLPYDTCPIGVPVEFTDYLRSQQDQVMRIKGHIVTVINEWAVSASNNTVAANAAAAGAGGSPGSAGEDEKKDSKTVASSMISKKFMEWLMASEHSQTVLDLVRMDSEKQSH